MKYYLLSAQVSTVAPTNFHHKTQQSTVPAEIPFATGWTPVDRFNRYTPGHSANMDSGSMPGPTDFTSADKPAGLLAAGNAFRSDAAISGRIAAGTWTFSINHTTGGNHLNKPHRYRFKVYKATATGASATVLHTSTILGDINDGLLSLASGTLTAEWESSHVDLVNQYLFFAVALELTTVYSNGDAATSLDLALVARQVKINQGPASFIQTPDMGLPYYELTGEMGI